MQKQVLIIGAVFLVIIIGGIFLLLSQTETRSRLGEPKYSTTPTQWSQEGDYRIEETSEGIVVTNEKAGFSFKVPDGWSLETQSFGENDFNIELFSPDAIKKEGNPPISKGCGIGLNTLFQEDEWFFWKGQILEYKETPDLLPEDEEIINIGGKFALKTSKNTDDPVAIEVFGEIIQIHIPINNNGIIEFGITMMTERKSDCKAEFDTFISSFSID